MRGWAGPGPGVRAMAGGPGKAGAAQSRSMPLTWRSVRAQSACRNAGLSGPDRSSSGSCAATQAGSASTKMTACAVNPMTPASRGDDAGQMVTPPSAGGKRPAAASSSRAASGGCLTGSSMRPSSIRPPPGIPRPGRLRHSGVPGPSGGRHGTVPAVVVLAHISDLHIDNGRRAAERAARVMTFLATLAGPVDAVVVTGDIADHGLAAEYEEARDLLGTRHRVLLCPGNHDARAAYRQVLLGEPAADGPINAAHELDGLVIAMCDSTIPGRSDGSLDEETLS